MTTEFSHPDTDKNQKTNRGGGFWGRQQRRSPEPEHELAHEQELVQEPVQFEEEASPLYETEEAVPEPVEASVPSWLKLSKTMDETTASFDASINDDLDSTAPFARLSSSDVVIREPEELEQAYETTHTTADDSAEVDTETAEEDERAVDEAASGIDDFDQDTLSQEEDLLSWDDDVREVSQPSFMPATAAPFVEDIDEPVGYERASKPSVPDDDFDIEDDHFYEEEVVAEDEHARVNDQVNTSFLSATTVYQEGHLQSRENKKKRLRIIVIAAIVVVILVCGYFVGVNHYAKEFLPNTHINGLRVSGMTIDEAVAALEDQTATYTCDVSVGDFSTKVEGKSILIDRDEQAMAETAMASQSAYAWPMALFVAPQRQVEANTTFDEGALGTLLTQSVEEHNEKTLPTTNASIDYNEATGLFELSGTTKGVAVDAGAVVSTATQDVRAFNYESKPAEDAALHEATVRDIPSYAKTAENANRSRTNDIPILVNGEEVINSPASQNMEWVKVGAGPSVSVDEDAVRVWAEDYVTSAVFHTDDWSNYYLDVDKFVEEFSDRLANGVVDGYEAPTYDELRTEGESREMAYAKGGWDATLGRYIDVDLESQFARLYDDAGNVIWESAFVSGDAYQGRSTVTGVFEIYAMQTNTTLVGMDYNNDGQPDYESFVNYWMPFYGGYGLHDATWRSHFGGDYYYYDGSHGCVNLPYSKAEELYGITHVGEKVNVHW